MIGLILGGVLGIKGLEKQVKEDVQVDLFFNPEYNETDIKMVEMALQKWPEFSEVYFVSPTSPPPHLAHHWVNPTPPL